MTFDFGLTEAEEARAGRLHRDSVIVDLVAQHAGGSNIFDCYPAQLQAEFREKMTTDANEWERLTDAEYWPYELSLLGKSQLIRDWYFASGLTCGTYGVGVHDGNDPLCRRLESANLVLSQLPWLRCVTTAAQIREAKRDGVVALYAQWQPVSPIPRDLRTIDAAYEKGLRSVMLTYNRMDNIGVGCTERVDAGLSMFGIDVLRHCNDIGMIVDVSHCGQLTAMDACRHTKKPVTANHTAAQGVYRHARGKSDAVLRAIADTGGVIGVVAAPPFLTDAASPTVEHMLAHIDYISNLVGWRHVALGTDWPLQAPTALLQATLAAQASSIGFREQDRLDLTQRLQGFEDSRDLPNITRGLVKHGYNDQQIEGILGENALRVFAEVLGT
jgi:membrane dipeptidase